MAALDLARDPPEVRYYEIDTLEELELIETIRGQGTRIDKVFIQRKEKEKK